MDKLFAQRIWGIPWSLLALAALCVAVFYLIADTSNGATGPSWIVLRWFHSLCWFLLALAALAMARIVPLPADWAPLLATGAGLTYAIFVVTGFIAGKLP